MKSLSTLKAGNARALKEVERAEREIRALQRELKAGTLDRKKLDSGLKKVQHYVCKIPTHVPPFDKV
jgi:plasmid stabilization system protein ParE